MFPLTPPTHTPAFFSRVHNPYANTEVTSKNAIRPESNLFIGQVSTHDTEILLTKLLNFLKGA